MSGGADVTGLTDLVKVLRGSAFKDVNRELRSHAKAIASDLVPAVQAGVRASRAPQADAMAATVRVHSDRVPVVAVGKVNPRFKSGRFQRRGSDSRRRRGALALGVVSGPAGGKRSTKASENYYAPQGVDGSWGALGNAINGPIMRDAEIAYLRLYIATLKAHGLDART